MKPYIPPKKERRRAVRLSLLFCALCIGYIVYVGSDSQTHVAALYSMIAFAASIIIYYIKGDNADAKSFNDTIARISEAGSSKQNTGEVY